MRRSTRDVLSGAGLALAGIGLVELLLAIGLRPLSPVGWPGVGMLAGAAVGGVRGMAAGAAVVVGYYLLNLFRAELFPQFYAGATNAVAWGLGLAMLGAAALLGRRRVLRLQEQAVRAASAEAELAASRRYEAAARADEERLRLLMDSVPALVAYIDTEERYRFANRVYEEWLGIPARSLSGRAVREAWGSERYALVRPNIERALRGERVSYEYTVSEKGVDRRLRATYVPELDASGNVSGCFVLAVEITELAAAQSELRAARSRLESALEGSSVALWDTDLRTGLVYLSEAWADIVGSAPGETRAELAGLMARVHPDDQEAVRRVSVEALKGNSDKTYSVEHRVVCAGGEWKWILSRGRVTERDPATGRALRMIGTNIEITDHKRIEEALQSVALTDPLTGLANRTSLMDRLRFAGARSTRSGRPFALLYLDIDHFKRVNDSLGHAAGDDLLAQFAARLSACVRQADTVARLGGDEFVVLLEDIEDCAAAERVATKVLAEVTAVRTERRDGRVTTSIGIACANPGEEPESILKRADAALYRAKRSGRNQYRLAA